MYSFYRSLAISLSFAFLLPAISKAQIRRSTDILVVGGGTGGVAAGIQAARSGVQTLIVESTNQLGGMLTAAGVSCTDGNDSLPSGIWEEFRKALHIHYGKTGLATGWVSETCFEPHVGDSIFKAWARKEKKLTVLYHWYFSKLVKKNNRIDSVYFENDNKEMLVVSAKIVIDATELGDILASAGVSYDVGTESAMLSDEKMAPGETNIIQDITWVAILKDYGKGVDKTISKPSSYKAEQFYCCCSSAPCKDSPYKVDALGMLNYASLPNHKFMLNWPAHGNDYYLNVIEEDHEQREKKYQFPKDRTLGFIYFIQTALGFKNLGLAEDELSEGMALIPYNREGRRMKGLVRLNVNFLEKPFDQYEKLYRTGIAVGDYPVDHHHSENLQSPKILFPLIPSFNIPLGALIPEKPDNLIVCEKGISVSNIVNGATRLQPVVLLTGQAAGLLAAWSIRNAQAPASADIRSVQAELLAVHAWLMPYVDVGNDDPDWASIQRVGSTGILKGVGMAHGWANKTFFYPDKFIGHEEFVNDFEAFNSSVFSLGSDSLLTVDDACAIVELYVGQPGKTRKVRVEEAGASSQKIWKSLGLSDFNPSRPIRRRELAVLLDKYAHVFEKNKVDVHGFFESH